MPLRQRSQEPQCKEKWKLRSQDKIFLVGDCRKPSTHTDTPHCSRGTGRENWKKKSQKLVSQDKCSLIGEGKNEKRKKEAQEIHSPPPQAEQCPASPQKWLLRSQTTPSSSLPDFIAPHNILWRRISPWPLGASWVPSPPPGSCLARVGQDKASASNSQNFRALSALVQPQIPVTPSQPAPAQGFYRIYKIAPWISGLNLTSFPFPKGLTQKLAIFTPFLACRHFFFSWKQHFPDGLIFTIMWQRLKHTLLISPEV